MCISNVKSSLFKYCRTTKFSSSLIVASCVGPGVVWVPLRALEVAAVVVPPGGVAPGPPSVVPPLARSVCVPVLVTEGQTVVALAPPGVLVLVVESLVLVIESLVLVIESLVLVVESLVLEVAVEPVVIVVEGLTVEAATATVLLLSTKEAAKEPCARLILARSLPPSPSIGVAGATLACWQEKPLLPVKFLPPRCLAATKVGLSLSPSTGVTLALLAPVESTLDGWAKNCRPQGSKTQPNDAPVQCLVARQGGRVSAEEELLIHICWPVGVPVG